MNVAITNRIEWIQKLKPWDAARPPRIEVYDVELDASKAPSRRSTHRRQRRAGGTGTFVAMVALVISGLAGALVGSGTLTASGRFNAERLAVQRGETVVFGLAQVPGHPGSSRTLQRGDMIRKFIALDGVN